MSGLTIRPARPDEQARVGELSVAAYQADGWAQSGGNYIHVLADAGRRARDAELLVAVDGSGELVGTVTICRPGSPFAELCRPGELEFRMLAVDPRARGRGIGEALVQAVIDRARAVGAERVVLCTVPDMQAAQRVYERLGFRRAPDRDWSPTDGMTLIAYCHELA